MTTAKRLLIILTASVLILLFSSFTAGTQSRPDLWAYYFSGFVGAGSYDATLVFNGDVPLRGEYDSRDPAVMSAQITEAQNAGVDAFIISWYGQDEPITGAVLENAFAQGAAQGFSIAISIDASSPAFNRTPAQLGASINRVMTDYINRPNYLRYRGRPIIFFSFQHQAGLRTTQWQQLRNQYDFGRNTWWIAEGTAACCVYDAAMNGMWAYNVSTNPTTNNFIRQRRNVGLEGGTLYFPTIHPGWNNSLSALRFGQPTYTLQARNNGQFLLDSYNAAVGSGADAIILNSWNAYYDGSYIEPGRDTGTVALDTLRLLTGGAPPVPTAVPTLPVLTPVIPAATPLPGVPPQPPVILPTVPSGQTVEAAVPILNVRRGPGTFFAILGSIRPGTQYPVIRVEGGWILFNFNGNLGYVLGRLAVLRGSPPGVQPSPTPDPAINIPVVPQPGVIPTLLPVITATPAPTVEVIPIYFEAFVASVNVRSGPGTDFPVIGSVSPGVLYLVIAQAGDWVVFNFNGQNGYVLASLVTPR